MNDEDFDEKAPAGKGKKTLKEIMNRTRFDKYELEEYIMTEGGLE